MFVMWAAVHRSCYQEGNRVKFTRSALMMSLGKADRHKGSRFVNSSDSHRK